MPTRRPATIPPRKPAITALGGVLMAYIQVDEVFDCGETTHEKVLGIPYDAATLCAYALEQTWDRHVHVPTVLDSVPEVSTSETYEAVVGLPWLSSLRRLGPLARAT